MLLIEQMMMAGKVSTGTSVPGGFVSSATPAFLWTWGNNGYGQNGDSPRTAVKSWSAVSTKLAHTLAIRSDGGLFTWGHNANGQLGTGDTTDRNSPVQIGTSSWTAVAAGSKNSFAITSDGELFAWGYNNYYQLGDGSQIDRSSPVQIGSGPWTSISVGDDYFTMGIRDGGLFTWGTDTNGQLGLGYPGAVLANPNQLGSDSWTAVSAGQLHAMAIRSDGALFGWGQNYNGATGVISEAKSWTMISAGYNHTLAIQSDGTLWGWGLNNYDQIGDYTFPYQVSLPTQIGSDSWTAVSAGRNFSLGIKSDGALFGWGLAFYGNLGDNYLYSYIQSMGPARLDYSRSWTAISAGRNHALGIDTTGQLWGWGNNGFGQLGIGYTGYSNYGFTSVPMTAGIDAFVTSTSSKIQAGNNYSLVIAGDSTLWAFGNNNYGRLGTGTSYGNYPSPIQVGTYGVWTHIATANQASAGIRSGYLYAWGDNAGGTLGFGDYNNYLTPTPLPYSDSGWTNITGGQNNNFLGVDNGHLYAWGNNGYGQLGLGVAYQYHVNSPVLVSSATISPSYIATGARVSYYLNQYHLLSASGYGSENGTGVIYTYQTDFNPVGGGALSTLSPVQVGRSSWTEVRTSY